MEHIEENGLQPQSLAAIRATIAETREILLSYEATLRTACQQQVADTPVEEETTIRGLQEIR